MEFFVSCFVKSLEHQSITVVKIELLQHFRNLLDQLPHFAKRASN